MRRFKPAKILVDRLTSSPEEVRFEMPPEWWAAHFGGDRITDEKVLEPFHFDLRVSKPGADILLEGTMNGVVEVSCSRCAARYGHALREDVRLLLEPAGERVPAEPESADALARTGMCLGDELDVGWYRGAEVELDAFLAEVISLALPMQPQPPVDESGCCSVCGIDCRGPVESIEDTQRRSPFAALAVLQGGRLPDSSGSDESRESKQPPGPERGPKQGEGES